MKSCSVLLVGALTSIGLAYGFQRNEGARITIKRATDEASARIPRRPVHTTIEEMLSQVRPQGLDANIQGQGFQTTRAGAFETTKWVVEATITQIIKRPDGDFYCVIESKDGAKTVFEAPDPDLCAGSHYLNEIKRVRKALDEKFHPSSQPMTVNLKVQVTGLGFFGYQGKAPNGGKTNGARLMPVIGIKMSK